MTVDDMGSSAEKSTVLIFQQSAAIVKGEFFAERKQQILRSRFALPRDDIVCHP
jgi:hypothetical protein